MGQHAIKMLKSNLLGTGNQSSKHPGISSERIVYIGLKYFLKFLMLIFKKCEL